MGTYLEDNRPTRSQFRCPRRARPSGVMVVHTAENAPDFVAFDGGAEAVANFIRTRPDPGSYHDIVDSDSGIQLVPYTCEAYQDGTGSNSHAWGGSVATRADVWPLAPDRWRDGAINQLASAAGRYARWIKANYGITVPARRITRAQSEQRIPGFISHAERDPKRRSDPGRHFPWDQFLAAYARLIDTSPDPEEGFLMALNSNQQEATWRGARQIPDLREEVAELRKAVAEQGSVMLVAADDWKSGEPVWMTNFVTRTRYEHNGPAHRLLRFFRASANLPEDAVRIPRAALAEIPVTEG